METLLFGRLGTEICIILESMLLEIFCCVLPHLKFIHKCIFHDIRHHATYCSVQLINNSDAVLKITEIKLIHLLVMGLKRAWGWIDIIRNLMSFQQLRVSWGQPRALVDT